MAKDQKIYNLAMTGQSIYDGINVLNKSYNLPKFLLVEINTAIRGESADFTKDVLDPSTYYSNKYFPILRTEFQPLSMCKGFLSYINKKQNLNISTVAGGRLGEKNDIDIF